MLEIENCPNCNSNQKKQSFSAPDRHYGIKGIFKYSECMNCRLLFLDPMPSDKELMAFYPEDSYYSYNVDLLKKESKWKTIARNFLFLSYITKDPTFSVPGVMLDIGCGNGWFIYAMRNKGWNVKGVEPSKSGAEAGRKMAGLDIHHGDLMSANYPENYFDYIRSNHSFEHIHNPNEVLSEIYRILKPGGKVLIGVPNISSINGKIFKQFWYYLGAPLHTFNYSSITLPMILSKHNFKNIEVIYNSNYNGVLGSLQVVLNNNTGKLSHQGFVMNFFPFKIIAGFFSKVFDLFKQGDCIEVIFEK